MRVFIWSGILAWLVALAASTIVGGFQTSVWTALLGASVAISIGWTSRLQARRQATLDLHREYYSHRFAEARLTAARFFKRYPDQDWSKQGPYDLPDPDNTREGYSEVLRFWHRVAVLYENGALDRALTEKLLSRELGHWFGLVFESMRLRKDMYTKDLLFRLRDRFLVGEDPESFRSGYRDGAERRPATPKHKWVRGERRWTTKGRAGKKG